MIKAILLTLLTSSCQSAKLVELDLHAKHQLLSNDPHQFVENLKKDKNAHKVAGLDELHKNFAGIQQATPIINQSSVPLIKTAQVATKIKQPPGPPGNVEAPGHGIEKSPGPAKKVRGSMKGGIPNTTPDNQDHDIYYEKDNGSPAEKARTSLYKDKNRPIDDKGQPMVPGQSGQTPAKKGPKQTAEGINSGPVTAAIAASGDKPDEAASLPAQEGGENKFKDGPNYEAGVKGGVKSPDIKDDKRAPVKTVKPPQNPDKNPDPKGDLFYTAPPPEKIPENVTKPANVTNTTEESNKTQAAQAPAKKKGREYVKMTLSKLTYDNDSWTENNDKYHYRNMKMHTSRMIQNKTYGNMYYVRMSVGSPPQIQEMMVDTASSWSYLDTYDASGPDRSANYYLFSEERAGSLDCAAADQVVIHNGRGRGIGGPACFDNISPQGGPQLTAHLPIVLRKGQSGDGPLGGGVLGLGPVDESGQGASFVNYLFDQEKIDRNLFAVFPGKDPKITFGSYQEEGLPAPDQRFYSEVMHEMVTIKISGGAGWSLPLKNVNIGKDNFTPKVRNVQLDAASGICIFGREEYKIIADNICDFVNAMRSNMTCLGRSDDQDNYGPLQLANASRALIRELPHIKFQFDAYNFDLRPERYFHWIDTTPAPVNTTIPYPNKTRDGRTIQDHHYETGGKLFGRITTDMLTRGNETHDLADPTTWFYNEVNTTCEPANGTIWNGTMCVKRNETWEPQPESGVATFLLFPQADGGQNAITLGAPFLDDYYQVYNLEKNTIGLVPSVNTNPETTNGYYSSSKPENIYQDVDRPTIIWLSIIGLILGAIFRNAVFQVCYASTFSTIMAGSKGYSALEGGEMEEDSD